MNKKDLIAECERMQNENRILQAQNEALYEAFRLVGEQFESVRVPTYMNVVRSNVQIAETRPSKMNFTINWRLLNMQLARPLLKRLNTL